MSPAQVRNKQVTKHFTEKTIKELWRERLAERKAGRNTEMVDFMSNYFQKRLGIMAAVVEVRLMNMWHGVVFILLFYTCLVHVCTISKDPVHVWSRHRIERTFWSSNLTEAPKPSEGRAVAVILKGTGCCVVAC